MSASEPSPTRTIDLRGEVCPYTFLKSKLALEEMAVGEVLQVIVDHRPAVDDVPKGFRYEGQEVLLVEASSSAEWKILVRKVHA